MLESELSRMMIGREVGFDASSVTDRARVDGGALALCHMLCNAVRPGKRCEHRCQGEVDAGIFHCSHMDRMRAFVVAVLESDPKQPPSDA